MGSRSTFHLYYLPILLLQLVLLASTAHSQNSEEFKIQLIKIKTGKVKNIAEGRRISFRLKDKWKIRVVKEG